MGRSPLTFDLKNTVEIFYTMSVIHLLLTLSLIVALVFLILFLVAVKKGQYDDLDSPPVRLITPPKKTKAKN